MYCNVYIQEINMFTLSEFVCPDGSNKVILDMKLVDKLQELRNLLNSPIFVISGYRTPEYNTKISGAKDSYHLFGKAADISSTGYSYEELYYLAIKIGFMGVGVYDGHVHVDVRDTDLVTWDFREKNKDLNFEYKI